MKINGMNVDATLKKVETFLSEEKGLSPAMRSMVELLVLLVTLLANRLNLNSSNSSKPPSGDPNRKKVSKAKGGRKAGGQKGRVGVTLQKVDEPDKIEVSNLTGESYHRETIKRWVMNHGRYLILIYQES